MSDTLLPIGYGLIVWWVSTGLVLYVVGLSGARSRATLGGAALLLAASLAALVGWREDTGAIETYGAFTAAIGVWGAQEIAFLSGWITGSWRSDCPAGARGWARTGFAVRAVIHHELALAVSGLAVVACVAGGTNQVGAWTYGVLFAMRISAKLNVFLGVPNITENFLPAHLAYLKSFFGRASMNLLFPVSVTVSTVALILLGQRASGLDGTAATALVLLATLVALGLLEHWFLVLPLPVEALWTWGLASRDRRAAAAASKPGDAEGTKIIRLEPRSGSRIIGGPAAPGRPVLLCTEAETRIAAVRTE
ncbi:putative photosynthetic complex assembly protein PuhE [uncultured Enterovirga sp.]|uniref:putative photosynthetic complex assembly protein PuhE n=1 Tax=uncultured Enterovirga sp. TaxID=2026352 RepID=UPI0035CC1C34